MIDNHVIIVSMKLVSRLGSTMTDTRKGYFSALWQEGRLENSPICVLRLTGGVGG